MPTTDPEDPDTFEESGTGAALDVETPEADAAEQRADLRPDGDEEPSELDLDDADEADAAEQARSAGGDGTDEYR